MISKTEGEVNGKKKKALKVAGCKLFYKDDVRLEDELYTNYAEALLDGTVSTKSFLGNMIQQSMQRIATDSKKDGELALRAVKELNNIAEKTQKYFDGKKAFDTDFIEYNIRKGLFPWQKPAFDDRSKRISVLAGRRAGKSYLMSRIAVHHCLIKEEKPRQCIIMGLTLEKTAQVYWGFLKDCITESHVPVRHIDNSNYIITFSNGNEIMLWGNNSKSDREKLRGKDSSMFIIDECQSQTGLYYLVEQVIGPILKGRNGQLLLLGTAPLSAGTYWESAIQNDTWAHYHATMEDNPTIPNYETALEDILNENKWSPDNIVFRREYLGEIAYDTERLILPKRTYYDNIPQDFHPTKCYIGVDYGWRDYSSIAPILIDEKTETAYAFDIWKANKTPASEIVDKMKAKVESIHNKWNIPIEDILVVADTSHQNVSADFYNQGIYRLVNAYKLDENYQWSRLAEALETGMLLIQKGDDIDMEADRLVWKYNEEKDCVIYKIDEDAFHPDILDSVKYAWNQYLGDKNAAI